MPTCDYCGTRLDAYDEFECTYCDGVHCTDHRVPESHACPLHTVIAPPWESKLDEDRKYEPTVRRRARGKSTADQQRRQRREKNRRQRTDLEAKRGPEAQRWHEKMEEDGGNSQAGGNNSPSPAAAERTDTRRRVKRALVWIAVLAGVGALLLNYLGLL